MAVASWCMALVVIAHAVPRRSTWSPVWNTPGDAHSSPTVYPPVVLHMRRAWMDAITCVIKRPSDRTWYGVFSQGCLSCLSAMPVALRPSLVVSAWKGEHSVILTLSVAAVD